MTTEHRPELVSASLLELTHSLGRPDLAILAEGNTSERLDDGRLVVKASGARMLDATADDFVTADVEPLMDLIASPRSTQSDLTDALDVGDVGGRRVRGSIETLIHVAVQAVRPTRFVAHTHPTVVVGLLSSVHAADAFELAAYSDEAVVLGRPLYVPYAQPGIDLGRLFHRTLVEHTDRTGDFPRLILLGNHGMVATADTAAGAEAVSEMAVKAAQVRAVAYAAGGLRPLTQDQLDAFFARDDITERQTNIADGRW